jgi:hypothetical protein
MVPRDGRRCRYPAARQGGRRARQKLAVRPGAVEVRRDDDDLVDLGLRL